MQGLVFAGLRHYRGVHAMVIAGVAVAVAVLAGALTAAVRCAKACARWRSLRLGRSSVIVGSPMFFRQQLANDVRGTPVVTTTGALVHEASGRVAARVQVYGIDDSFLRLNGLAGAAPEESRGMDQRAARGGFGRHCRRRRWCCGWRSQATFRLARFKDAARMPPDASG